jgi:hypothetical protein
MIRAFKDGIKTGFVVGAYVGGFALSLTILDKGYTAVKNLVGNYTKPDYLKDDFDDEDEDKEE